MIRCSKPGCGRRAIFTMHYASKNYCKKHFIELFERRVRRTVREFRLVRARERILVGLSGGKDSTALLHVLKPICDSQRAKLFAICIDEGIEGYRNLAIDVARRNCEKLGVPLRIQTFKEEIGLSMDEIAKVNGRKGTCTYCGVFRRWIMNRVARQMKVDKVALAHNLDDSAQTVLMNLMRNEPFRLARFGPISGVVEDEGFVPRIKPFFKIPEREVALYSMLKGSGFIPMDCPYAEEAFRSDVREHLNALEERVPGTKQRIVNSFLAIKPALQSFYRMRDGGISRCEKCGEPASQKLCQKCRLLKTLLC